MSELRVFEVRVTVRPAHGRFLSSFFLALVGATSAPVAQAEEGAPPSASSAPVIVSVASVEFAEGRLREGDASATFGIINLRQSACYAIAPPTGALIEVGESYAVVPASEIDEEVRAKLRAAYPKCAIVQTVAHVVTR